jgi:DNA repair protein RadC
MPVKTKSESQTSDSGIQPQERKPTMRDTPAHERPRERLVKVGPENLSEVELLAIIISRGTKGIPVRDIAQQLISKLGSVAGVAQATYAELLQVPGIGPAKACQILAAFELARRADDSVSMRERVDMADAAAAAKLVRQEVTEWAKESFWTLWLDARNRMIGREKVSVGCLDTTLAHPREVFNKAIRASAAAIIVVHNHPTGEPTPSDDDVRLTRRLAEAGKIIGIRLLDHIIIAKSGHYSFRAHSLL